MASQADLIGRVYLTDEAPCFTVHDFEYELHDDAARWRWCCVDAVVAIVEDDRKSFFPDGFVGGEVRHCQIATWIKRKVLDMQCVDNSTSSKIKDASSKPLYCPYHFKFILKKPS